MSDPYATLDAHLIHVKALHCEDGCGTVETTGLWDDRDAARELEARGWKVRPHSTGDDALTALCKQCAAKYDIEREGGASDADA